MRERRERSCRAVDEVSFARAKTRLAPHPSFVHHFTTKKCFVFYPKSF